MPNISYGLVAKQRAKLLLESLLDFVSGEIPEEECGSLRCNWQEKERREVCPKLLVRATIGDLAALTRLKNPDTALTKNQIKVALRQLEDFLEILEDHRVPPKRGPAVRPLTLTLWSKDKEENLRQFDREWEQKRPDKGKLQEQIYATLQDAMESERMPNVSPRARCDWGEAPDVPVFYGRFQELSTLETWILHERCRLLSIVGIGGVGKTNLSVRFGKGGIGKSGISLRFARGVQGEFDCIMWRSLLNAPPFAEILLDCIAFFSNQQETHLPDTIDRQLSRLFHYLQQQRCLLVLDNMESVLEGGSPIHHCREGYEGYGELLRQAGECPHQSCVLITSREVPQAVARLEGHNSSVRLLRLGGLSESEARKIFERTDSIVASERQWQELIGLYNGNPLALKLVAAFIQVVYAGNIADFLQEGQPIFGSIESLLDWHFMRLSEPEKEVMYWLAINRESVSHSDLKEDVLSSQSQKQIAPTLYSLHQRSLLERKEQRFFLQPVLIEYLTARFVREMSEEVTSQRLKLFDTHAVLKAQSKDHIRKSQKRLIVQPIIELAKDTLRSGEKLGERLREIATLLRAEHWQGGYAGGNLLNLLAQSGAEVDRFDLSGFTIRQADLQKVHLHNVDFSRAKFVKSVFTQTFGGVQSVRFSPDGTLLAASSGSEGEIRLWHVADGQECFVLKGHTSWVCSIAFSPDGTLVASGSDDSTIRLWDVRSGNCVQIVQSEASGVRSVAFSPDGRVLASGNADCTVKVWNVQTGECLTTLKAHTAWILSVTFSQSGSLLASAGGDSTITLWDARTARVLRTFQGHTGTILSIAIDRDEHILASCGHDGTIRLWDVQTGRCIRVVQEGALTVWSVAFALHGQMLASASDEMVKLWNLSSGLCEDSLHGHQDFISSLTFAPDGNTLASGSEDMTVKIWDVRTGKCTRTFQGYTNAIHSVAWGGNGSEQILASGGDEKTVKLWNVATRECVTSFSGHAKRVRSVTVSPDATALASGSDDKTVRLWDIRSGECLHVLTGHSLWVLSVLFSPDGCVLASGSDDASVRLWDTRTGQCRHVLQGHDDLVSGLAFSPDSRLLVTSNEGQTAGGQSVRFWDVRTGQCLNVWRHCGQVISCAFSPDGQTLVMGCGDATLSQWDIHTGECLQTFLGHTKKVRSVALSFDGARLVSGGDDKIIGVWDVNTGRRLTTLSGHTGSVRSVSLSLNGETLASCSEDETIRFWNIHTGEYIEQLRTPRLYEGINIMGAKGLTSAQRASLKRLGAVEEA
jgi:WD40 repeat protein